MREYIKKPENQSRTLDSNPRASRQASISEILQTYKNGTLGRQSIQRESREDEELFQAKFGTTQREKVDEDDLLQGKFDSVLPVEQKLIQQEKKFNNTGLPDNLKSGIENLSGYSMDDVKVHYNSNKPAQLNALAYAQGTDIHVAPGQEEHLPHEAWHVVQQKQGRVQPTMQLQGVNVNDNEGLEKEADDFSKNSMDYANKESLKNISNISTTLQLIRMDVRVKNPTHIVVMKGKSIFRGMKVLDITPGTIIRIETEDGYLSRRGEEFRKEDSSAPHSHIWYRVLYSSGIASSENIYIRRDTYDEIPQGRKDSSLSGEILGTGAKSAPTELVNLALRVYEKTGLDVLIIIQRLHREDSSLLGDKYEEYENFANILIGLGDGASEASRYFLNHLDNILGKLKGSLPKAKFIELLNKTKQKTEEMIIPQTEKCLATVPDISHSILPIEEKSMSDLVKKYDVISRKCSASTRRIGAIHEVDLALMERCKGIVELKAIISDDEKIIIKPGQNERAFAIGFMGAISFKGSLSTQGGERLYAVLFPKGWISTFSQDIRTEQSTYREPGEKEFCDGRFTDKEVTITISAGKAFLIRGEESTRGEGQITVHMDRNRLLFGGKPMLEFIRQASLGAVEFDTEGKILKYNMF